MARPKLVNPATRARIIAAACEEFGARGFAATTVDRIARRARVNKAMIYYHFPNKRALYTSIVRDQFGSINERIKPIAAQDIPLDQKLDRLIDTLVRTVDRSQFFLPFFLREIADGAAHLGPEELSLIASIFQTVSGVIVEGGRRKVFRTVHPALAHFTIIAPLVMFRATAPVRARFKALKRVDIPDADSDTLVKHLQTVARGMLATT